ncbi:Hypothetical protein NTJ_05782 [Nesidiocoris tenuis]|uniref:Uncharacterized protein n=1 Tax=Nesidiocoris tenuis TaxID=355587 RepID=A0ABN7ALQ9_9HEMI|nr:Hypothetical protein NTJ_05782 [Nesidiocoris tenuis]
MYACVVLIMACYSLAYSKDYDDLQQQNDAVSPLLIAGIPYGSVSGRVAEYFATMKPSLGRVRTDSYGDVLPPSDLRADHTIGLQSI